MNWGVTVDKVVEKNKVMAKKKKLGKRNTELRQFSC